MGEGVFLDTVGLIATLNKGDEYHRNASMVFGRIGETGREVVTTNLVLAEVGNGLARTPLREEVGWLISQLHADPGSTVVHVDRKIFAEGVDLYLGRGDKLWGLVDCVNFVTMRAMGLADAFTADHHFQQAGLNCLLSPVRDRGSQ